ncbi:hypothetical protein [Cecembia calidifontis]|nr:hypothetical protein [Cecembia calidifontis]
MKKNLPLLSFEILEAKGFDSMELIVWGPIPTNINKIIGETVGVVRGEEFAIGIQALNPKTLGGFPWLGNDTTPQLDIFEQDDYSDLNGAGKRETLYQICPAYCRILTGIWFSLRILSWISYKSKVINI